jgi:hypothetical protein
MNKIDKQKDLLLTLAHCKKKIRTAILQNADRQLIEAICECIYNLLKGNIELKETDKENLYKYRHILRKLVKRSNLKQKKKIIIQKGGFLQYLIPAAITGISLFLV